MSTLFHVSLEVNKEVSVFFPKLPTAIYKEEDGETPRISLSTSIAGCLSGVPWGGRRLENVIGCFQDLVDDQGLLLFKVYEFDSETISAKNLISNEDLLSKGLVMDANVSDEVWVVEQSLKPIRSYFALLTSYSETACDIYSLDYYHLTEEDWEDVDDLDEFTIGCATKIEYEKIQCYESKELLPFQINFDEWEEICSELKENNYEE